MSSTTLLDIVFSVVGFIFFLGLDFRSRILGKRRLRMWDWHCQEYDLGDDATIDMSNTLLNEGQTDDFFGVFDAGTTPVQACGDLAYQAYNSESDKDFASSQVKRRRKLQFESEESGTTLFNQDIPLSFLRSNESQDSFEEGISEMSEWVSGFAGGGTSTSGGEVFDQSYDGWLADCLNDTDMQMCSQEINSSDPSDVHIDITDLCDDTPPKHENNVVQPPPVRTRGNVAFKGRKSYMKTPAKVSSSVVYPFAFIKPCSVQGEVTLKDINQRIRNPASKAKPKKETDYPTSAISGKPVVGKTKIHTVGGKGSITIMRTKG